MLTSSQQRPVHRPPHLAAQACQPLPDRHHLALDKDLGAHRDRPQVRRVDGPAHAQIVPEPGLGHQRQGHRGAVVEQGRDAAAVQVAEPVAVLRLDGIAEESLGVREGRVGGEELEVGDQGGGPVLVVC